MSTNEKTTMQMAFESHNRAEWDEYYMRSWRQQQWEAAWKAAVDDQRHRNQALLQQALDALIAATPVQADDPMMQAKSIVALTEALAAPATLTPSEMADRIAAGERWAVAPQQSQELVTGNSLAEFKNALNHLNNEELKGFATALFIQKQVLEKYQPNILGAMSTQLQTQRQPLTDEQIDDLLLKYGYDADDEAMREMIKDAYSTGEAK